MLVQSHFSRVRLFETLWTVARQAPLSMGFSRQELWSGLPVSSPGDLPNLGIESTSLRSPALQADSLPLSYQGSPKWCIILIDFWRLNQLCIFGIMHFFMAYNFFICCWFWFANILLRIFISLVMQLYRILFVCPSVMSLSGFDIRVILA